MAASSEMSAKGKYEVLTRFVGDEDIPENIIHISKSIKDHHECLNKAIVKPSKQKQIGKKQVKYPKFSESKKNEPPESSNSDDDNDETKNKITDQNPTFADYFFQHGNKKHNTSMHTLSDLKIPTDGNDSWKDFIKKLPDSHEKEKKLLNQNCRLLYKKWYFLLNEGFSLLLYGLGSKINIMEDFYKTTLSQHEILIVNGFFPGLTIKHILNKITEEILKHNGTFRDPIDQVNFIKERVNGKDTQNLYLIINNIDSSMFCSEKNQTIISLLAQSSHIHVVASIDHINAPLSGTIYTWLPRICFNSNSVVVHQADEEEHLAKVVSMAISYLLGNIWSVLSIMSSKYIWDQEKLSRYNWIWFDVTSFHPYCNESSYENSLLTQKQGKLALSSLLHVFNSLTPNAQGIFLILANYQHEHKDSSSYIGMSFQDCYQHCREAFLVNSDLTLRVQLTEFRDHKLLRSRKSVDGAEHLYLLLDVNTLNEFLELQEGS